MNLIIGQNNSGKSNVLRFIHDHYNHLGNLLGGHEWVWKDLENFRPEPSCPTNLSLAVRLTKATVEQWIANAERGAHIERYIDHLISGWRLSPCGEGYWLDAVAAVRDSAKLSEAFVEDLLCQRNFARLCHDLLEAVGQPRPRDPTVAGNIHELFKWISRALFRKIACVTIPGLRSPTSSEPKPGDFSGAGIVHRIAQLQNPEHHEQEKKEDFLRIEGFLREVTDRPDAKLEVPYRRETIVVHMDGRSMPLEALGTGIHEVIILAAAATSLHKHVICVEEPEVHLHPLLQKKLLRYLDQETDNQYFISTHSAHLLDHPGAAVFHVRLTPGGSIVTEASSPTQRFAVCTDLGYRASDLLQTNCVVWVEGPSDRIYIREWLRLRDPELCEGIDYSIMFYGGRLLSHLSPNDPEVTEFISLRHLNRNMVVVMDSDKKLPRQRVNETKRRIVREWSDQPGFAWITAGREIENYVVGGAMHDALKAVAPSKPHKRAISSFDPCIRMDKNGRSHADKVKVAHWLADNGRLNLDVLDLRRQIEKLAHFIRESNHERHRGA